jgi:hypothetical protein
LKEVEGYGLTHWKPERTTTKMEWLKEVDWGSKGSRPYLIILYAADSNLSTSFPKNRSLTISL